VQNRVGWDRSGSPEEAVMKGASKPKKLQKKQAQKTLKEKRSEKKAAGKKFGSS
jgi:hypothetical protein